VAWFVDPDHGHVHDAFNPTDEETEFVATFFEAPAQGPRLIPAQAPKDCDIQPSRPPNGGGSRARPNGANRRLAAVRKP
jgi:hypothetical protein